MRVVARAACYFFVWPLAWHQAGAGGRRVYPGGSTLSRDNNGGVASEQPAATPPPPLSSLAVLPGAPFTVIFSWHLGRWPLELAKSRPWASGLSGPLTKVG